MAVLQKPASNALLLALGLVLGSFPVGTVGTAAIDAQADKPPQSFSFPEAALAGDEALAKAIPRLAKQVIAA